jgi:hypothetical protein
MATTDRNLKSQVEELLANLPDQEEARNIATSMQRSMDQFGNSLFEATVLALHARPNSTGKKRSAGGETQPAKKPRTGPTRYTEWMLGCKAVAALPQCTAKQIPGRFNTAFKTVYKDAQFAEAIATMYARTEEKFKPADSGVLTKEHLPADLSEWVSELYKDDALKAFFDAACTAVMAKPEEAKPEEAKPEDAKPDEAKPAEELGESDEHQHHRAEDAKPEEAE